MTLHGGVDVPRPATLSRTPATTPRRPESYRGPFLTQRDRITPVLSSPDRCSGVMARPGAFGAPRERGSYQHSYNVISSGGGGNRTRSEAFPGSLVSRRST
jgi:hypothetical protein